MFLEFVPLGFLLGASLSLASPMAQQWENRIKKREVTRKQIPQNLQNGFEQGRLRSSVPNQGYLGPASNDGFSDYEAGPNLGFVPAYDGFDRRRYKPNSNTGFDSLNLQGFGNENQPGWWNRPIGTRPASGDSGLGAANQGPKLNEPSSDDGNQWGSGGTDDQRGSDGGSSGGANRRFENGAANGFGNEVRPPNGGQPWTTVRAPVNRIFGEFTVPQLAQCIRSCPSVSHYDPVCGSDNITYTNRAKLQCARQCGRAVTEAYPGSCATATVP